uniref:Uncharacterized protein n=1 Tax=Janibacter limosus TaxID=53458 RepID=A0AC61U0N0_9MICO|nr:hypothetical protein [Janibacter limosus]
MAAAAAGAGSLNELPEARRPALATRTTDAACLTSGRGARRPSQTPTQSTGDHEDSPGRPTEMPSRVSATSAACVS